MQVRTSKILGLPLLSGDAGKRNTKQHMLFSHAMLCRNDSMSHSLVRKHDFFYDGISKVAATPSIHAFSKYMCSF
jgi:hypothetical protein